MQKHSGANTSAHLHEAHQLDQRASNTVNRPQKQLLDIIADPDHIRKAILIRAALPTLPDRDESINRLGSSSTRDWSTNVSFSGDRKRPFMKIAQFCRETLASLFGICRIDLDVDGSTADLVSDRTDPWGGSDFPSDLAGGLVMVRHDVP
jgi:hypothetical protein